MGIGDQAGWCWKKANVGLYDKAERAAGVHMLRRGFPLFSQRWLDQSGQDKWRNHRDMGEKDKLVKFF